MINNISSHRLSLVALSILLVSGCSSTQIDAPDTKTEVPGQWAVESQTSYSPDPWWKKFNDEKLNQLITQVLESNDDLALATLTLKQARLNAGLSAADQYPDISSSLSTSRSREFNSGTSSTSYSANLSVGYELDLWGRVGASVDASKWSAMASQEDRESTAQSLASTAASLYWQIGYLNARIALSNDSIDYARETLALTEKQYQSGAVTYLNVLEAKRSLAGQEASHSELEQQRVEANNSLAVLLKQPPQNMLQYIDTLPNIALPEIEAGVPADVLGRRPDVKAALYELRSALSSQDATEDAYFPTLNLTGSISDSSSALSKLLSDPVGTLGASLTLPFLQWNEMKLNEKLAEVEVQSAIVTYRQTLYGAFEEVNNALSARQHYQYQSIKLQEQFEAAHDAERIYASQYQHGAVSAQDWMDAQETLRSSQESLLENLYNQYNVQATLYQALGGRDIAPEISE